MRQTLRAFFAVIAVVGVCMTPALAQETPEELRQQVATLQPQLMALFVEAGSSQTEADALMADFLPTISEWETRSEAYRASVRLEVMLAKRLADRAQGISPLERKNWLKTELPRIRWARAQGITSVAVMNQSVANQATTVVTAAPTASTPPVGGFAGPIYARPRSVLIQAPHQVVRRSYPRGNARVSYAPQPPPPTIRSASSIRQVRVTPRVVYAPAGTPLSRARNFRKSVTTLVPPIPMIVRFNQVTEATPYLPPTIPRATPDSAAASVSSEPAVQADSELSRLPPVEPATTPTDWPHLFLNILVGIMLLTAISLCIVPNRNKRPFVS